MGEQLLSLLASTLTVDQLLVLVTGCGTVHLSQDHRDGVRRWACWLGLIGQPAWLWTAWHHQQGGGFILSILITCGWLRGIHNFWLKPWLNARTAQSDRA